MRRGKRVGLLLLIIGVIAVVGVAGWTLLPSFPSNPPDSANQATSTNQARSSSSETAPSSDSTAQEASAPDGPDGTTSTASGSASEAETEATEASDTPDPSTAASETADDTSRVPSSAEPQTPSAQPSSQPDTDEGTASPNGTPSDAEAPDESSSASASRSSSTPSPSTAPKTEKTQPVGVVERGELALEIDGDRFSEETYKLARREDGTHRLHSEGTFSVPVMVADVSFDYTQTIRLASAWQPRSYTFDLSGPLGFGNRHIEAEFNARSADVTRGGGDSEPQTYQLERDRSAIVGMLASYTLIPKLLGDADVVNLSAMVVSFRGEDGPSDDKLAIVPLRIQRAGPAKIRPASGGDAIDVTHVELTFNVGSSKEASPPLDVYIQGDRFLALHGRFSEESSPFRIYDLERFPDGFETA
ncbi:MAG: hypothetical protein ABEK03_02440, partial [Candidatus Bipolaricaulia bacterium]